MANVQKSNNTRSIPLLKARIGAAVGSKWYRELTGANLFDFQAGARTLNSEPTFRGPTISLGAQDITSFTYEYIYLPHLGVFRDLDRAHGVKRALVGMRHDAYSQEIPAIPSGLTIAATAPSTSDEMALAKGASIAITGTGQNSAMNVNTLKGMFQSGQIDVGDLLQIGGTDEDNTYIVNRIEVDEDNGEYGEVFITDLNGDNLTSDLTTSNELNKALNPGWRLDYTGEIVEMGSYSGDASGNTNLKSRLVMAPKAILASSKPLYITEANAGW